jgi:hypothetical protein
MTKLRDAIRGMSAQAKAMPKPKAAPTATAHALQKLEAWVAGQREMSDEEDAALLARVRLIPPHSLPDRDVRNSVPPAWRKTDRNMESERAWVLGLTNEAVKRDTKRIDRALVLTWLECFPEGLGASDLAAAAKFAASRRDWPYNKAGDEFNLWDRASAAKTIGKELLRADDPDGVLRRAALNPGIYSGNLVQTALEYTANTVATGPTQTAARDCNALLDLLDQLGDAGITTKTRPLFIRALLMPWTTAAPDRDLRVRIQKLALKEYGDPRFNASSWARFSSDLVAKGYGEDAEAARKVLLRWLNSAAFDVFFRLIGRSTANPVQWAAREEFWRHYLEKDYISRAFFILGPQAVKGAKPDEQKLINEAGGYGHFSDGADVGHSAFLMEIGDVIIAEWTHDGSCCFWKPNAVHRPEFENIKELKHKKFNGRLMRKTDAMKIAAKRQADTIGGQVLWDALSHNPPRLKNKRGWHSKFARHIRSWTGIAWSEAEW